MNQVRRRRRQRFSVFPLFPTPDDIVNSYLVQGERRIHTDQPAPAGGDSAPSPFDLFLASIATCMGFYAIFRNRAQSLISDMEIASTHILALLGVSYGKKREAQASRVPVEDEF